MKSRSHWRGWFLNHERGYAMINVKGREMRSTDHGGNLVPVVCHNGLDTRRSVALDPECGLAYKGLKRFL